ncbi:Telomerase Cajal body protein 1 [Mactra antiquata]
MENDKICPIVGTVNDSGQVEDIIVVGLSDRMTESNNKDGDNVRSELQGDKSDLSMSNPKVEDASLQAMKEATLQLLDQVSSDIHVTADVSVGQEVSTQILSKESDNSAERNDNLPSGCSSHISDDANAQKSHKSENVDSATDSVHIVNVESSLNSESQQIDSYSTESGQKYTPPSLDPGQNFSTQYQYVAVPLKSDPFTVRESDCEEPVAKKQKIAISDIDDCRKNSCSDDITSVTETPECSMSAKRLARSLNCYKFEVVFEAIYSLISCVFRFSDSPRQVTGAWKSFDDIYQKNYLRGCKWAPDGTCLLTNSNDNLLKIFNLPEELYYDGGEYKVIPEMKPVVEMKEADTIYDFCWFPLMSSSQPDTACLCVTSKDTPVHLYDAFTGELRCSYRAYNHVDEVVAAHCINFNLDGSKLFCGFNKIIRVFDVTRPGRDFINRPTFAKEGQRGIISCIDHSPTEPGLYAAGSYSRSIALYNEPDGSMICMYEGQQGGVTQVKFSPDGTKLYSGGRRDNEIICWDMRNPGHILFTLQRYVSTNQRIYFDITSDGRYVVSGSNDGIVRIWDTTIPPIQHHIHLDPSIQPCMTFQAHKDTVNSVSLHPSLPVIATGSGERHFKTVTDHDEESMEQIETLSDIDNSLRLWWT